VGSPEWCHLCESEPFLRISLPLFERALPRAVQASRLDKTFLSPDPSMATEHPSVTLFREYVRIKTVQPKPDYGPYDHLNDGPVGLPGRE
jgi:hypothetical protein